MAIESFITIQSYLTLIILIAASVIWYQLKTNNDVTKIKSYKIYNLVLLLAIPFIVKVFKFIPERLIAITQNLLFLIIFFALMTISIKSYKSNFTTRKEDFSQLLEDSKSHPIRMEFARVIVKPELDVLSKTKSKIEKENKALESKENKLNKLKEESSKKEEEIKKEKEALDKERKDFKKEKGSISNQLKDIEDKKKDIESRLRRISKKEGDINADIKEIKLKLSETRKKENILEDKYDEIKSNFKNKLRQEYSLFKKSLSDKYKKKEIDLDNYEIEINKIEKELNEKKKETDNEMKRMESERINFSRERARIEREKAELVALKAEFEGLREETPKGSFILENNKEKKRK